MKRAIEGSAPSGSSVLNMALNVPWLNKSRTSFESASGIPGASARRLFYSITSVMSMGTVKRGAVNF